MKFFQYKRRTLAGGGGLVQQLRKSYSLSDLTECEPRDERCADEADDVLTEPRLIRRATVKSGYNTRRSASESNSRSPMYFPEVDVDLRAGRASRGDEPDFSHIKSSEDISSGYSSADNSASLTRTASLSAASRAKVRSRTTVTTIKRPQAAEESEVIIEELHDDDSFDYTNMPPLLNLPHNLYLSNTEPPFIYQLVGDQVRVIQVLGTNISSFNIENNDPDQWDQKEAFQDASPMKDSTDIESKEIPKTLDSTNNNDNEFASKEKSDERKPESVHENKEHIDIPFKNEEKDNDLPSTTVPSLDKCDVQVTIKNEDNDEQKTSENITKKDLDSLINPVEVVVPQVVNNEDPVETTSLDTSMNDNDSAESDDEASFGTPDDSPKSKRKSPKGKYGKGKAPPPPSTTQQSLHQVENSDGTKNTRDVQDGTEESLFEFVKTLPNTGFKETGKKGLQVVNPIAEKKLRHKSKSPGRIPKSGSGIGKLLQFPGKLAFWKNDDKTKDTLSTSSGDHSRRSSTIERTIDDFQSCNDLNELLKKSPRDDDTADDHLSFKDAEIGSEIISQDIIDKSDELQKLIEAKIESHPEYKYLSLHGNTGEIPSSSKSTDV